MQLNAQTLGPVSYLGVNDRRAFLMRDTLGQPDIFIRLTDAFLIMGMLNTPPPPGIDSAVL